MLPPPPPCKLGGSKKLVLSDVNAAMAQMPAADVETAKPAEKKADAPARVTRQDDDAAGGQDRRSTGYGRQEGAGSPRRGFAAEIARSPRTATQQDDTQQRADAPKAEAQVGAKPGRGQARVPSTFRRRRIRRRNVRARSRC